MKKTCAMLFVVALWILLFGVTAYGQSVEEHYKKGFDLFENGDFKEAIYHLRIVVKARAEFYDARVMLAEAFLNTDMVDEAINEYRVAIRLKPNIATNYNDLCIALGMKGLLDEAIKECRTAVRLDPTYRTFRFILASTLSERGLLNEAIAEYHTAIKLEPNNPDYHSGLADVLAEKGLLDDAVGEYREALRLDSKKLEIHASLGIALLKKGDTKGAVEEFTKSESGVEKESLASRISIYRKALRSDPSNVFYHYYLGMSFLQNSDVESAVTEFQTVARLGTNQKLSHESYYELGYIHYKAKNFALAATEYKEATRLDPKCASSHNELGMTLESSGNLRDALESYRKASELDPKYKNYQDNYNRLRQKLNP